MNYDNFVKVYFPSPGGSFAFLPPLAGALLFFPSLGGRGLRGGEGIFRLFTRIPILGGKK
jgi:hypothetical protein